MEEKERKRRIKLLRSKRTDLEKIREEIERILRREKREEEKKTEEEKEKRRKRREENEERQRKEKERRENEENKIREKIKKDKEDKIKSAMKKNKEKSNDKNNKNNKKNLFGRNKNKDDSNKSWNINKSRRLYENPIKIIDGKFNNENDNNNKNNNNKLNNLKNYNFKSLKNKIDLNEYIFDNNEKPNLDNQDHHHSDKKFRTIFSDEQKTESDYEKKYKKMIFNKRRNKNKYNINIYSDPLNPYLTNWTRSFLKLGFNAGICSNKVQDGVPVLRIQQLRPKLEFPPIYKVKYNQFSEESNEKNNYLSHDDFKKDFFDSRNSSYNEIFSSDRKLNYDKDINIDEKNITIDVSDKNI